MRRGMRILLVVLLFSAVTTGAALRAHAEYLVREVISMGPGEAQTREFYLESALDLLGSNYAVEPYLIIAAGDNETRCGELSITVSTSPAKTFGSYMVYGLAGFAYGLGAAPELIYAAATTPWKIEKTVALNAVFGFVYAGSFINKIVGDVELPAAFTITYKLSAKEND